MKKLLILALLSTSAFASHIDVSVVKSNSGANFNQKKTYELGSESSTSLRLRSILDIQKEASVILGLEKGTVDANNIRYRSRNDKELNYDKGFNSFTTVEIGLRLKF